MTFYSIATDIQIKDDHSVEILPKHCEQEKLYRLKMLTLLKRKKSFTFFFLILLINYIYKEKRALHIYNT